MMNTSEVAESIICILAEYCDLTDYDKDGIRLICQTAHIEPQNRKALADLLEQCTLLAVEGKPN